MIFDVNAYLGHYAFRRLRNNTADGLLKRMDALKIDRAAVSSASAIAYRNAQPGNEEVDAEVRAHRDRLVPFAVINPAYAGWKDDLRACRERFGMRGLRLYPNWHNYRLDDPRCLELVREAASHGMVISIPIRVEDHRGQSWLVDVPDVPLGDVAALVRACPEARFLVLNGIGFPGSPLGKKGDDLPANYKIEISRLTALLGNEVGALVESLGADRVVFGTGMPFSVPEVALLKLEVLGASEADKRKILGGNAAEWLPDGR